MNSVRYFKADPTTYVIQYQNGGIRRNGAGLSFFYFAPTTSLVAVPLASQEAPFMFSETTADHQEITLQGQLVFRIVDPERLAGMLNYTLGADTTRYRSDDPEKLGDRILNLAQVALRAEVRSLSLREALASTGPLVEKIAEKLAASDVLEHLGVTIVDFSIIAIKPVPETARALEAATREALLKEADDAVYTRRNASIEQERSVKENELKTELAVEARKREIRESQIEADRVAREKKRQIEREELAGNVELEQRRSELVDLSVANERKQGKARADNLQAIIDAFGRLDPALVEAAVGAELAPDQIIARAFKTLAGSSGKIGNLNISPELLDSLVRGRAS